MPRQLLQRCDVVEAMSQEGRQHRRDNPRRHGFHRRERRHRHHTLQSKVSRQIERHRATNNDLADSATDSKGAEHDGISEFGEEVVKEMNRLGIMVDVSHASDDVFYDAIALSKAPIIASHSNARAVTDHQRNMSDEMLQLMAENGGVVQLTMLSDYLRDAPENPARDAAVAELRANMKPPSEMTQEERAGMREAFNEINEKFPTPLATVSNAVEPTTKTDIL